MLKMTLIFNKSLNKIVLPIMILLVITIAIPIQTANALIRIDDLVLKFVVTFTKTGVNKTQIENFLGNQLFPPMRDKLNTKLNNNFINHTISKELSVFDLGNDRYQVYPKIFFSGNTTLNKTQLNNGLDATIDDWFTVFETELALQNATDVEYHMHKSFGTVEVSGAN